jgi:hypothetical protein
MPSRSRPALLARRALAWSLGWGFAAALYLLLIDITQLPELLVGALAAVLAATGMELAREQAIVGERARMRWLLRIPRATVKIPADIAKLTLVALRGAARLRVGKPVGAFRAVPFAGAEDEQREAGRRALAEAFGSLSPNTVIVGVDERRHRILAHQLRPDASRSSIDPMGLGEP